MNLLTHAELVNIETRVQANRIEAASRPIRTRNEWLNDEFFRLEELRARIEGRDFAPYRMGK